MFRSSVPASSCISPSTKYGTPRSSWPESRVFSIASSPCRRECLRISYSVQGKFTARMEKELQERGNVWVKLPFGDFVIDQTRDVVLLGGGTGITAFMAFLEDVTPEFQHDISLGYGARNRDLLLYRDVIEEKARVLPRFHRSYFVEKEAGASHDPAGEAMGRLSAEAVWKKVRNPGGALWYLSGPPVMLKALTRDLGTLGLATGLVRIDAWE